MFILYLRGDKLHLVVSIHLSGFLDGLGFGTARHAKVVVRFDFAFLAKLQCTARSSTSCTVAVLSFASVLAQLSGVADANVRREEDEQVTI